MHLQTARLIIRDMMREDLDQIQAWRPYTDPLEETWNLYWRDKAAMDYWFAQHTQDPSRRSYVIVLHSGQVIGRLSLRHIRPGDSAVLGISLGADWVNQGYGTEAIKAFAQHFFQVMGFRTLLLDVAAINRRAIRCYEKCGFIKIGSRYQPISWEEARTLLSNPDVACSHRFIRKKYGRYWQLFYDMKLESRDLPSLEGEGERTR